MRKARWHPELFFVLFRQLHADPLTKCVRSGANIYGNVKYAAAYNPNQLSLGFRLLKVQSSEYICRRARVIVLDKLKLYACFLEIALPAECLEKEASVITEYAGFNDYAIFKFGGLNKR